MTTNPLTMAELVEQPQAIIDKIRQLIDQHLSETDKGKARNIFEDLLDLINEKYGIHPTEDVNQMMLNAYNCDKDKADRYLNLGYYYQRLEKLDKAIESYQRSHQIDGNHKALANLAVLYSLMNDYEESLKCFKQSLDKPIDDLVVKQQITYNYGFTLNLAGKYESASKIFNSLTTLYDQTEESKRNANFWYDFGDHYLYNLGQPIDAVGKYEKGLQAVDKTNKIEVELLLGLVNACNKCASLIAEQDHNQRLVYKRKAKTYFSRAIDLIDPAKDMSKVKLAELHFYNRDYEQAQKCYEALLEKDMSLIVEEKGDVYYFLGLCHYHADNFDHAIKNFNESMQIHDVAFLNIHLAQCYVKKQNFQRAEELLDVVLNKSSYNTNALISQVFLYSEWAESLKTSNQEAAMNYLNLSGQIAVRLIGQKDSTKLLRKLTTKEVFELKYVICFCSIEKSKLIKSKKAKLDALSEAKMHLSELTKENNNMYYFRSCRTLDEVEKIMEDFKRTGDDQRKPLITIGLLSMIIALFMIFFGKPVLEKGYLVDSDLLAAQLSLPRANVDSVLGNKRFSSVTEMQQYVNTFYAKNIAGVKEILIQPKNDYYEIKSTEIKEEIIIIFLSIGVVFTLLGYLASEVKVLKVGVIHIEKTEHASLIDQIELKMLR